MLVSKTTQEQYVLSGLILQLLFFIYGLHGQGVNGVVRTYYSAQITAKGRVVPFP